MYLRRVVSVAVALICLAALLAGCGAPAATPAPQEQPKPAGDGSLERVRKAGKLVVASTPTGAPFTFLNPESNKIEGIMIDIAALAAAKLGVKLEVVDAKFASLIPTLESQKADAIAAGMYITPERQKVVSFTRPIFGWGEALVVPAGDTATKGLEDLNGKTVAAQTGTVYLTKLQEKGFKEPKAYSSVPDMLAELAAGRIAAFVADSPIVAMNIQKNPQFKDQVRVVKDYKPMAYGETGFAVRPADKELHAALDKAVQELKDSGEVQKVLKKWGL